MPRRLSSIALALIAVLAVTGVGCRVMGAGEGKPDPVIHQSTTSTRSTSTAEKDFLTALDSASTSEGKDEEAPLYVTAVSFIVKLALVLGLAYLTILGLKRLSSLKATAGGGQQRIRVVENSSLGSSKGLHLVEIGNKKLLLASTPNQVSLITELAAEDLPETPQSEQQMGFKDQLAMFLGSRADAAATENRVADMLRDSGKYLQEKIGDVGRIRGRHRE